MTRHAEKVHSYKQDLEDMCCNYICLDNRTGNYVNIKEQSLIEENRIDAYAKRTGDYSIYDQLDQTYPLDDPNLSWIDCVDYIDNNGYEVGVYLFDDRPEIEGMFIQLDWLTFVRINDANHHGTIQRYANPFDSNPIASCKLTNYASMQLYKAAKQIWQRD